MSWYRSSGFSAVAIIILALLTASPAWGATAGIDRDVLTGTGGGHPGNADFGLGSHANGIPGPYSVTWDFTPSAGVVQVSARVVGTLYLDRLGSGCVRLLVDFQDFDFNLIARRTVQFCGPGFDANNSANQRAVDISSANIANFPDSRLRHVQLTIGSGSSTGSIENDRTGLHTVPRVDANDIINNGTTDLGGAGPIVHAFGSPVNRYPVTIELQENGLVRAQVNSDDVNGILFWDSTSAGTACLIIDFQDSSGAILNTRIVSVTAPIGGNALQAANQRSFGVRSFTDASVFKIRLRVGTGVGPATNRCGTLAGVATRTYSLGPAVGSGVGSPFEASVHVGEETAYSVEWTVPEPENWHSLDTLLVRLVDVDDDSEILQIRFDEATNSFSRFHSHLGRFGPPVEPGSHARFESPDVALLLRDTEVIGTGETGPSVTLNLALQFKPGAAGRTFAVEMKAADDSGTVQGWDKVGRITVPHVHHGRRP
jgi:hypothetical protein